MKVNTAVRWCILTLLLVVRLHRGRTLKSNSISTFRTPAKTSSRNVVRPLQGSRSWTADCPVLPPCSCVQLSQSDHQGPPTRVRVMCDSTQTSRRRVLRFSKSAVIHARSFGHLSLAYAGLNALPATTFRHIKVIFEYIWPN